MTNSFHIRLFAALLLVCSVSVLKAQEKVPIEILGADALEFGKVNGESVRKMIGNVKLRQDSLYLYCDSAYFYTDRNAVDAFSHVHIKQGDSLNIYAETLKYDGDTKQAELTGGVRLTEPRMTLTTPTLYYNIATKQAHYVSGGLVTTPELQLTSRKGYYLSEAHMAYFRDSVRVKGKDYSLAADTLGYNIDNETSYFYGPTDIVTEKTTIYCETGWFNSNSGKSRFGKNTILHNPPQILYADSLYYDQNEEYGEARSNFVWVDTTMDVILSGRYADFYQAREYIVATDSAMLTYVLDNDSLFLGADTLISTMDSAHEYREFYAYYHVLIYKSDLQGKCDSLSYSYKDSTIRMYNDPILWTDVNQLTGDTILLTLKNNTLHDVELFENGFIISQSSHGLYDQIKGRHIFGYFKDAVLDRMHAVGNGETVYFGKDSQSDYIGVNKAICSEMWLYLQDNKVSRISFNTKPEATFSPIQQIDPKSYLLDGFIWRQEERPMSKAELFER